MKRLLLVLFTGLLLNVHVFAQWDDYDYDDYDSDDYGDDAGVSGSSNPTVVNDGTQGYSEQKLTLPNSQPIYLYFYNTVQNPASPEPQTPNPPPVQPAAAVPSPYEPEPVIEYRYLPAPAPEPIYIPSPQIEYIYIQPPPPPPPQIEYIYLPPPQVEPVYIPLPARIRVIPGLPNPDSSRVYRLQIGAYAVHTTADKMAQRIRSAGLQAGVEYYNSLKRVFVPDVRAADAYSIVQMLELLGFQEVWIRE
jgi:cell division protein FtsN